MQLSKMNDYIRFFKKLKKTIAFEVEVAGTAYKSSSSRIPKNIQLHLVLVTCRFNDCTTRCKELTFNVPVYNRRKQQ